MRTARIENVTITEYKPRTYTPPTYCRHIPLNETTTIFKCRICQNVVCLNCECVCYAGKRETT